MERYLDLDLLVNGSMDAFLLVLTGRLLNISLRSKRVLGGTLAGEIPVILSAFWPGSILFELSKLIIPFLMVWLAYPHRGIRTYLKELVLFWILSAGLGGLVYALWSWLNFDGVMNRTLRIGLQNLWLLLLIAAFWWAGQRAWQRWMKVSANVSSSLYNITIDFGPGSPVQVKAMLDTGNQLRDPLTGVPVILVEEEVAAAGIPENLLPALNASWREQEDPWPWLWTMDPEWMKHFVFISYQAVGHKSWLLGIRPHRVFCHSFSEPKEIKATLALVKHVLSSDGTYQALLHPEHVQGAEGGL